MVSVQNTVPSFVLDADVDRYLELADPPVRVQRRLREADRDERVRLMARGWYRHYHGSENEAKRLFVLLMKEEGIPFNGEDI
jgi:hypothetical protein